MQNAFQTGFGRQDSCAQSDRATGPDKWQLLTTLTKAADHFELSHRSLTVLKALLSFLPTRNIPVGQGAVVFPANATLSERLHGMPESTLRRHLARLVRAGIVIRQDSPNRKRYARRVAGAVAIAFGFDLSPLAVQADRIQRAAQDAEELQDRLRAQRARILMLRHQLIDGAGGHEALVQETNLVLRRKPTIEALNRLETALSDAVDNMRNNAPESDDPSANDNRNERHIQELLKSDFDSERCPPKTARSPIPGKAEKDADVTLAQVLRACGEFQLFYHEPVRNWRTLVDIGDRAAPMLGIEQPVLAQAKRAMGIERAAIAVMCIFERFKDIRSPGAYLRRLAQTAEKGGFSISPMVQALLSRQCVDLSADNG